MQPVLIVGCIRSGTTILHKLLLSACPKSVDLTDDDFEGRYFWQDLGLTIGSRSTGTYCCRAGSENVDEDGCRRTADYIESRTQGGKFVITKSPHLLNKISFVGRVLPAARFVLIIRDPMSVVASKKGLFQSAHTENEDYPPFVHYWPEETAPCWWTVQDDRSGPVLTAGLVRRKGKEVLRALGLKKRKQLTAPGKMFEHERMSAFLADHPELSRYYPGSGFARIPEAWLTLNVNACRDLTALEGHRWLIVTYSDLVREPRRVIAKICDFADLSAVDLNAVPDRLDESRSQKWRSDLTGDEQEIVSEHMQTHAKSDFELLCRFAGHDLLAQ